jgi:hypothetical protein
VSQRPEATPSHGVLSPDNRKLVLALLGVLVAVFALVFSNVAANHAPKPHGVPVGVVGPPQVARAVASQADRSEPGGYEVRSYP